jgi:RNA polymerase sigma factor (sigma-70 family)
MDGQEIVDMIESMAGRLHKIAFKYFIEYGDLYSALYLKCYKVRDKYSVEDLRRMVPKIARNLCIDMLRKEGCRHTIDIEEAYNIGILDLKLEDKDLYREIKLIIYNLKEPEKTILSMYFDGYSGKEISAEVNMNENTARAYIYRFKMKMRKKFAVNN